MKKMKISKILVLILVLSMVVAGCAAKEQPEVTAPDTSKEGSAFEGKYLVSAEYVKSFAGNDNILLIDARGVDAAKEGTVEGAIAIKWQMLAAMEGKPGDPMWGTILEPADLSEALSNLGISKDKEIIVFGAAKDGWGDEGRITWELIAAGFENVKMVDGGLASLTNAGLNIVKGAAAPIFADVAVSEINNTHNINTDALVADYESYKVVDVRADEEYEGQVLYGEAKGGHLPGAIHIKFTDLFEADGTLKSSEDVTKIFTDAGLSKNDKIVTYCTAGIRSAYMQLLLEMTGFENSYNYDESFYRWSAVNELEK
ncbi:MAG: sulfurtransferase [Clostridiaceae bacterium]|jgi:thiosulfate/3-mercaptopyruvate sulfurtransferase|nr:sulfurtransferase [Clostridiaceae bacterium]